MNNNSENNSGENPVLIRKYNEVKSYADMGGYCLNPDREFTMELISSLLINRERYGYDACPCRLVIGSMDENLDIICPCDYRDDDVREFGCCYCGLYVSDDVASGKKDFEPIPDRRLMVREAEQGIQSVEGRSVPGETIKLKYPVFRCRVCGYLSARYSPPEKCPICGAPEENFEKFIG